MTTIVTHTIKPAGGGHFSSLNAWEAGSLALGDPGYPGPISRNLTALDQIEVAEVYSGNNATTGYLYLGSFTCDATRYVVIRAASGHEHNGVWDTNKAYLSGALLRYGRNLYSYTEKMQFKSTDNNPTVQTGDGYLTVNTAIFDRCLFIRTNNGAVGGGVISSANSYSVYPCTDIYRNCIIIDNGTTDYHFGFAVTGGKTLRYLEIYNCTILIAPGASWNQAIYSSGGTITTQNCYLGGNGAYYNDGGANVVYNKGANDATKSTDAVTPALRSIPSTSATFLNVTAGSENLRPVVTAGNKLLDNGANLSGSGVTTDIIGTARPQFGAFDIGAFENDIPICWNYTARYKGSNKLFKASGCGPFPKTLQVPSNVDTSTGKMVDDGEFISPDKYKVI